jgi:hypothetical protein
MAALGGPRPVNFGDFVADFGFFELRKHGIGLELQDPSYATGHPSHP